MSKSYPVKEIKLEDIASVEYLSLKYDDEYLFRGKPEYISDKVIIVYDDAEGKILLFSKDGTPVSKFNHKGNGPGEYGDVSDIIYDEPNDELFVAGRERILVYSPSGVYKRTLPLEAMRFDIKDWDNESLLVFDKNGGSSSSFFHISKEDGRVLEEVKLQRDAEVKLYVIEMTGNSMYVFIGREDNIVRYENGFLLTDHSLDTVYYYGRDKVLKPAFVRTPAIQTMTPVIYVNSFVEAGGYQFFEVNTVKNGADRFSYTRLMREMKNNSVYTQKIIMGDYEGKEVPIVPDMISVTDNYKTGVVELSLTELKTAYDDGKLKGKLKELVENLNEEDNDVYALLHFK